MKTSRPVRHQQGPLIESAPLSEWSPRGMEPKKRPRRGAERRSNRTRTCQYKRAAVDSPFARNTHIFIDLRHPQAVEKIKKYCHELPLAATPVGPFESKPQAAYDLRHSEKFSQRPGFGSRIEPPRPARAGLHAKTSKMLTRADSTEGSHGQCFTVRPRQGAGGSKILFRAHLRAPARI
jgi:hypothetical protein